MPGPNTKILAKINSIIKSEFKRLRYEAEQCALHRGKRLEFRLVPEGAKIRCDVEDEVVAVYLPDDTDDQTFEHHAAHELCHAIAGCCGFSYKVTPSEKVWKRYRATKETDKENAAMILQESMGSFLTHAAVHSLLQASGYTKKDWDAYLVEKARDMQSLNDNLANRAINIGWAIQYEELEKLGLPGLDVEDFKQQLRRLLPRFDQDYKLVRSSLGDVPNLLNVDDCLKSTKSLAKAFGRMLSYPLENVLTIDIACKPCKEWTLDSVTVRLSNR